MIERAGVPGCLLAVCGMLLIAPAQGAVRDCADFVEHTSDGQTEKAAKTSALDGWMKKVETLGMVQVRWQTAADRSLQCASLGPKIQCVARARPCVVKQVAPEGWRPQYPRDRQ
jgi:hypothetical protein